MTKTFWLEPVAKAQLSLRRFTWSEQAKCPGAYGYHNAVVLGVVVDEPLRPLEGDARYERPAPCASEFSGNPLWPAHCGCGYEFQPSDQWQVNRERLYSGCPDGQLYTLGDAPVGATWDAWWMGEFWKGPDGVSLAVRCPGGGGWMVDGVASNCTLPDDKVHKCWVRHGDPRQALVTVDKNGVTCGAGGGSIITHNWHGFLRNGVLVPC